MQLKSMYKVLATTVVLGQLMAVPGISHADTNKQMKQTQQQVQKQQEQMEHGLTGAFFKDANFSNFVMVKSFGDFQVAKKDVAKLVNEKDQQIQSVRWVGFVKPSQTGDYTFSTSSDQQVMMQVDGKKVMEQAPMKEKIKLEKDKLYPITIEYRPGQKPANDNVVDFSLSWSMSDGKMEKVPQDNLFQQNATSAKKNKPDSLYPEHGMFPQQQNKNLILATTDKATDTATDKATDTASYPADDPRNTGNTKYWSNAGHPIITPADSKIPDYLAVVGFTVDHQGVIVPWTSELGKQGLPKYTANPYIANKQQSTTGDPFEDTDKAIGKVQSIAEEARNPLVAAAPVIQPHLTNWSMYLEDQVGTTTSHTNEIDTGKDTTTSSTWNVDGGIELGKKGISVKVGGGYSQTKSETIRYDKRSIDGDTTELNYNTANRAKLLANVTYANIGSADIYDVQPVNKFSFKKADNDQLSPIGEAAFTDALKPGRIAHGEKSDTQITTGDSFGAQPIQLAKDMVDALQNKGSLVYELNETKGYTTFSGSDKLSWVDYQTPIENNNARISIKTHDRSAARFVAVPDNQQATTLPDMTVRHALGVAFGINDMKANKFSFVPEGASYTVKEAKDKDLITDNTEILQPDGTQVAKSKMDASKRIAQYSKYTEVPKKAADKTGDWMVVDDTNYSYNNIDFSKMNIMVTSKNPDEQTEIQNTLKALQDAGKSIYDLKLKKGWSIQFEQRSGIEKHDFGQGKKSYYFNPNTGEQQNGEVTIAGQAYYFKKHEDTVQAPDGKTFVDGEMLTGKVRLNGKMMYFGE
ncbi:hypothetical protein ER45_029880 (plasmid) [Bacillus mycoides]|nr:hypothetical protein ER45_029880 [Bacillus mycoides]